MSVIEFLQLLFEQLGNLMRQDSTQGGGTAVVRKGASSYLMGQLCYGELEKSGGPGNGVGSQVGGAEPAIPFPLTRERIISHPS